jgi:hypothetical protein
MQGNPRSHRETKRRRGIQEGTEKPRDTKETKKTQGKQEDTYKS